MNITERFLNDEQDPKAVEKVLGKLSDLLVSGEELLYLAVQKKPAVNLLPDCIVVSNKRIFYCEPANFGMTMNFKDISWKSIKEVSFKEEIFGSKFICVPQHGENIITEYIPKVQARKLYQAAYEQLEAYKEQLKQAEQEERRAKIAEAPQAIPSENEAQPNAWTATNAVPEPSAPNPEPIATVPVWNTPEPEDETTLKLRKLKTLYDKQLITLEEYEAKKASILADL